MLILGMRDDEEEQQPLRLLLRGRLSDISLLAFRGSLLSLLSLRALGVCTFWPLAATGGLCIFLLPESISSSSGEESAELAEESADVWQKIPVHSSALIVYPASRERSFAFSPPHRHLMWEDESAL